MGGSQLITVRTAYYSDLLLIGRVFGSKFDKFTLFSCLALQLWCINHNVYIRIGRNLVNDDPSFCRGFGSYSHITGWWTRREHRGSDLPSHLERGSWVLAQKQTESRVVCQVDHSSLVRSVPELGQASAHQEELVGTKTELDSLNE